MIDLDEMQAAINRCAFDGDVLGLSKAECADLLSRLREAEADAKRYRWLRDEACHNEWHTVGSADPSVWDVIVDEYIEEAMNHEASDASDRVEP